MIYQECRWPFPGNTLWYGSSRTVATGRPKPTSSTLTSSGDAAPNGLQRFPRNEQPVYKTSGRVTRAHRLEGFQVRQKILPHSCGKHPECLVADHLQREVHRFCNLLR